MNYTKLLLIRFNNLIGSGEIEHFRGAVINQLSNSDILFHNHLPGDEGYRYSYPLIQYKRINRKAAILCISEGAEAIGNFFMDADTELRIGERTEMFEIDNIQAYRHQIQVWDSKFHYNIRKWMPLNQENYEIFKQLESIAEKSAFLEKIVRGNILSFAKGLNIFFDKQVECKITRLSEPGFTRYKGTKLTIFDAEFTSNVSIPNYVGLGKGVSIGYGITTQKKGKNK